jgi:hypothetical protein
VTHKKTERSLPQAWPKFLLFFLLGALLLVGVREVPPSHPIVREVGQHIGSEVIVAVLVMLLFQIGEVQEHLSRFAASVFVRHEYLNSLNHWMLIELRRKILDVLLSQIVTNKKYDYGAIEEQNQKLLFGEVIGRHSPPIVSPYRRAFRETIEFKFLRGKALAEARNKKKDQLCGCEERLYVQITTITSYEVIHPKSGSAPHREPAVNGKLSRVPFLKPEELVEYHFGSNDEDLKKIDLTTKEEGDFVCYERKAGYSELSLSDDRVATVCTKSIEVEPADESTYMLKRMHTLTEAPEVTVTSNIPVKLLIDLTMGMGEHHREGETDCTFRIRYVGWMAKLHGYMICWIPSQVLNSLPK